ncbi:hypothetical protein [Streptomyces sp. NPDC017993]|uniref:terpene synthase family protein n=1 Tax=Streptomyces sp. NPDC017993 TaxID=3365027 RepID=UPI0037B127D7
MTLIGSFWDRSVQGMAPSWCARAAHNWEYYFAAYVGEALDRVGGTVPSMEHFLQVRRGMAGTCTLMDYGERIGRFHVPPAVFHTPQLRMMRQAATDVPLLCNDVYAVHKEEPRGDVDNAVLVVQRERNLSRGEALDHVHGLAMSHIETFSALERQLPGVCSTLSLSDEDRNAVDRYVDAMKAWMRGYHQWETETHRYSADGMVPPQNPNYAEDPPPRPRGPAGRLVTHRSPARRCPQTSAVVRALLRKRPGRRHPRTTAHDTALAPPAWFTVAIHDPLCSILFYTTLSMHRNAHH